jgi:hypothetical protein
MTARTGSLREENHGRITRTGMAVQDSRDMSSSMSVSVSISMSVSMSMDPCPGLCSWPHPSKKLKSNEHEHECGHGYGHWHGNGYGHGHVHVRRGTCIFMTKFLLKSSYEKFCTVSCGFPSNYHA